MMINSPRDGGKVIRAYADVAVIEIGTCYSPLPTACELYCKLGMSSSETQIADGGTDDLRTTRHTGLWFEDGNIVIQAQHTVYKVHKSLLCRESPLFADTLSLPQSAVQVPDEVYDACPLLRVQEPAEGITVLLQALFDPKYVPAIIILA